MYLFIYKTTHKNGQFYIGRHQTLLLEDGYFGSGKWVKSIKDKTNLKREILKYVDSTEELYKLEEFYINLYWNNPLCMNFKKASVGLTSEDAKRRVNSGTHNFSKKSDGSSLSSDRVERKTHHFLKRNDGTSYMSERTMQGKNPFSKRNDGSSIASDRVLNGTNPLLKRNDGSSIGKENALKKVKEGNHHFLKRKDGSSIGKEMVSNGTHPFLKCKGTVPCYDLTGNYLRIPKSLYLSQKQDENKKYVHITSTEGKRRKNLSTKIN